MTAVMYACPRCGCRDLRLKQIPLSDNLKERNKIKRERMRKTGCFYPILDYVEVAECFKCGWREETPWEIGARMAKESISKLKLEFKD